MRYDLTMTVGCRAERNSKPLQRIDMFRGLRKLTRLCSHGYKIASVFMESCDRRGEKKCAHILDYESLVVKLFDLSLSYSVCGVHHSSAIPFVYLHLVENKDNSTTNIDSHFIEALSKLHFMKGPTK